MLQRIHDSSARWVAVILLGLVSVGFIFWRADFNNGRTATFAAKVNGENLSLQEFDRELQARQNRYQQQYRTELSEDMRRELRRAVVEDMVRDAVLKQRVDEQGYRVSDARVIDFIRSIPAFQVEGQFSKPIYENLLATQGFSAARFESAQRSELEVRDLQEGIVESTFLTPAEFRRYIELFNQRREIGYGLFTVDAFLGRVTIDEARSPPTIRATRLDTRRPRNVRPRIRRLARRHRLAVVRWRRRAAQGLRRRARSVLSRTEERHARHILIAIDKGDEEAARRESGGDRRPPAQGRGLREARGRSIRRRRHESTGRRPRLDDAARRTIRECAVRDASRRDQRPGA